MHQVQDMDTGVEGEATFHELTAKVCKKFLVIDWFRDSKIRVSIKDLVRNDNWKGYWISNSSRISIDEDDVRILKEVAGIN
jgi:hypothetical protein